MVVISFYDLLFEREWCPYIDEMHNVFNTVLNSNIMLAVLYSAYLNFKRRDSKARSLPTTPSPLPSHQCFCSTRTWSRVKGAPLSRPACSASTCS